MAAQFFLQDDGAGNFKRILATEVGGAGFEEKIPALDASGKLATSMMPAGIGADTQNVTTSEAIASGALVNLWNSTGAKARNADNSQANAGKRCHGYVPSGVGSAATAVVYFHGPVTGLSGLTVGDVFLGTAGAVTSTAPTASGSSVQRVGFAVSATQIEFNPETAVVLA